MKAGKKKRKTSTFLIGAGVLLITAALSLTGYNLWENHRAGVSAEQALEGMEAQMEMSLEREDEEPGEQPLYKLYPDMEMPTFIVDGGACVGILEIPVLDLRLPILDKWSYDGLDLAPCRYKGSVYQGNMIVAGHNFQQHFGNLRNLQQGDEIDFTDADGNRFYYQVAEIEVLPGIAVEEMEAGEWELTMFTCDYSGKSRLTVRCVEDANCDL